MKAKLKIKNFSGKIIVLEKEVRALDHLEAQKKFKSVTFRDKTKFSRHPKHRKPNSFDEQHNFFANLKNFLDKPKKICYNISVKNKKNFYEGD